MPSRVHARRPLAALVVAAWLTTALATFGPLRSEAQPPDPESLLVTPTSGPWFTAVTIEGAGCVGPPGTELVVQGRLHALGESGVEFVGQFKAFPAEDGSWSASLVVTHRQHSGGAVTPGPYEFRADCGIATTDELGNTIPAEPYLLTSTAPFEVLAGGPLPELVVTPTTVPIVGGRIDLTARGDLCARPDGPSSGEVILFGPEGVDTSDADAVFAAGGNFTPADDGTWSLAIEPASTVEGPMTPKPGVYEVRAICWLGTDGYETPNGFEYDSVRVTLVVPSEPAPTVAPTFTG